MIAIRQAHTNIPKLILEKKTFLTYFLIALFVIFDSYQPCVRVR